MEGKTTSGEKNGKFENRIDYNNEKKKTRLNEHWNISILGIYYSRVNL